MAQIIATLEQQEADWNSGDIEGFMEGYWRSPGLTFSSGGKVTYGWEPTLENYRRRYPDRSAMGRLSFGEMCITQLADDVAMVLGRWHLERDEPIGGNFTLIMRRLGECWFIIHDHTSRDEP